MIDSHCHLTYEQLSSQLEAVLHRAAGAGVAEMITIGTSMPDCAKAVELCRAHSQVRCSLGIHPHHAQQATEDDLAALEELQRNPEVVALGEMGLDYHYDFSPRGRQADVFARQLELARKYRRAIVIHCREAFDDCLAILEGFREIPAVFHCFTGSVVEARRVLDRGYLLGFTGVVTFKRSDELRQVVRDMPEDRILLETDAPYLAPEPFRKQRVNEPSLLVHTADAIAAERKTTRQEIDRITTENTRRFFGYA